MNASTQAETLALAKVDQARLERLAALTGRSPRSMLKFVLRDGFDAIEENVRETLKGEAECDAGQVFPHDQVMAEVRAIIGKRAGKRGKKAG